jgi:cyclopropane fatty-acyl-phospholipid synthase-like methyltransferase
MDPSRFSTIAHRDHDFCNPVSGAKIDRTIGLLDLAAGQSVLDVGCGKGELLVRIVERYRVRAIGVDLNSHFLGEARARAATRAPGADLTFLQMDFGDFKAEPGSFDVVACLGATHALGSYRKTLASLPALLRPGGLLLAGEAYWRKDPSPEYLAALDAKKEDLATHAGNVAIGKEVGLVALYSVASTDDEWDHYEGLYARTVERFAAAYPDDPDCEAMRDRIRRWTEIYFTWGRDTLGFGLYLFQKPADERVSSPGQSSARREG